MSHLHELKGRIVSEASTLHDHMQIVFDSDVSLSIDTGVRIVPPSVLVGDLAGRVVDSVEESRDEIKILFIDGVCIEIDMRPQAWRGPEALVLQRKGRPELVWNEAKAGGHEA
ncbi:hypothetical protein SAMN02745126_05830 [Enhydrobacter aerosaccus]|uniref:Uncharacterized protein n=1 Tax=Enhydrobacter aerosaccus TaxID=225324 RepID=A0A1T4T8V4_9HYPH|nr:hypothetical protein [Enhydrobacter aerosaccus]SKA36731.1 hypothetical protein SAMN02745126_05830 [Enhydrobacter aerosaccus]